MLELIEGAHLEDRVDDAARGRAAPTLLDLGVLELEQLGDMRPCIIEADAHR